MVKLQKRKIGLLGQKSKLVRKTEKLVRDIKIYKLFNFIKKLKNFKNLILKI